MYNRIFKDKSGNEWERIDKRKAKNLYNKGVTLVICPDNLRPFTPWCVELIININDHIEKPDFNKRINVFEIYNCFNRETGYHASFYMKREETNNV